MMNFKLKTLKFFLLTFALYSSFLLQANQSEGVLNESNDQHLILNQNASLKKKIIKQTKLLEALMEEQFLKKIDNSNLTTPQKEDLLQLFNKISRKPTAKKSFNSFADSLNLEGWQLDQLRLGYEIYLRYRADLNTTCANAEGHFFQAVSCGILLRGLNIGLLRVILITIDGETLNEGNIIRIMEGKTNYK